MKNFGVLQIFVQPADLITLSVISGITAGGHNNPKGNSAIKDQLIGLQLSLGRLLQRWQQVTLQAHHHRLGLRITKAAVKLHYLNFAFWGDHQTRVQKPSIGSPFCCHPFQRGQDDLSHGPFVHLGCHHRSRRISAHATSIRALVTIVSGLVILRGRKGYGLCAVTQTNKAGFFTRQKLFNNHPRSGLTEAIAAQHVIDGIKGLLLSLSHNHPLARGQSIRLYDDGSALLLYKGLGRNGVAEGFMRRSGNTVALHKIFAEGLRALELRRLRGGAEAGQAGVGKCVYRTGD